MEYVGQIQLHKFILVFLGHSNIGSTRFQRNRFHFSEFFPCNLKVKGENLFKICLSKIENKIIINWQTNLKETSVKKIMACQYTYLYPWICSNDRPSTNNYCILCNLGVISVGKVYKIK